MTHLKAVIFDWAGTVIDHGSLAPMGAFVETFAGFGIPLTIAEARGPMGLAKRPHIAALLHLPRIAEAWARINGAPPDEQAIDAIYNVFVPKNRAVAARHAQLIPGAAEVAARLRAAGLRIGSTTGYTREIMAEIMPVASAGGFTADCVICAGDTAEGRPSPLMIYRALDMMGVWPAWDVVKVDDTEVGIAEGLNAGCWTVGVAVSGNLMGLSLPDLTALPAADRENRRAAAVERLVAAGAHYVIDSIADLPPVLAAIELRRAQGKHPRTTA